jgi:hypothetical protein
VSARADDRAERMARKPAEWAQWISLARGHLASARAYGRSDHRLACALPYALAVREAAECLGKARTAWALLAHDLSASVDHDGDCNRRVGFQCSCGAVVYP